MQHLRLESVQTESENVESLNWTGKYLLCIRYILYYIKVVQQTVVITLEVTGEAALFNLLV